MTSHNLDYSEMDTTTLLYYYRRGNYTQELVDEIVKRVAAYLRYAA